ncbi:MAG: histidinol dehydrogenase [bacterium]
MKEIYFKNIVDIKKILLQENIFNDKIAQEVEAIIDEVKQKKDEALLKFTEKFDGVKLTLKEIKVSEKEKIQALKNIDKKIFKSIILAKKNIEKFHKKNIIKSWTSKQNGILLGQKITPIENVGIYVPGGISGKTPLVSSILMAAIPAKIAGVKNIIMCTPPQENKTINSYLIATAELIGIKDIYKIGGAHAISAMALGTKIVPKMDKIVGPGNLYVTLAKKYFYGIVDIDSIAGPSELLILADETASPKFIAADLLAQAEHQKNSKVILITTSKELISAVKIEIKIQLKLLKRKEEIESSLKNGLIILVDKINTAIFLINEIAPEHLSLMVKDNNKILCEIKNAGAIFIGAYSPVALGDYFAGPNHILPTSSTSKFFSGLNTNDFLKITNIIFYSQKSVSFAKKHLSQIALLEGLDGHARSVEIR